MSDITENTAETSTSRTAIDDEREVSPLRRYRFVIAVLAVSGAIAGVAFMNAKPGVRRAAPLEARLELAAGGVKVDGENALSGAALLQGAKIEASDGARALLRLSDGATVFLRGGTKLTLEGAAVAVDDGEVWLDAPPSERQAGLHHLGDVEVSAADAGVSLKRSKEGAVIYVARGIAVVSSKGGRVEVHAGEQAVVKGEAAPSVKPVAYWSDWTGGLGDHAAAGMIAGAGTLYGVDLAATAGTAAHPLEIKKQAVRAVLRAGFAETEVDQTFFNPGERAVEGWYWFSVPFGASVTGFQLETNGQLVDGELIEKKEASAQYGRAVAMGNDPALLEWIDGRTYRARIFPVPQGGTRRVVVRYLEQLPLQGGRLRYVYPMQSRTPVRIGEFSLSVDLGDAGSDMKLTTLADARVEDGGRKVTMRRSGYTPRADFQLEGEPKGKSPPVTVSRYVAGGEGADYVMMRYLPDVDWSEVKDAPGEVIVVVDTSAAGDDAGRQLKAATAEAVMRALAATDKFALVSLDVKPTVLHPATGLAAANDDEIQKALERLAEHAAGGATDMSALFDTALSRVHGGEQPAIVYVGDGIATSGETSSERLVGGLRRALSTSRARLFTVAVGSDANVALLSELARAGGGDDFLVESPDQTTERALRLVAAVKAPTITELDIDVGAGMDEVFVTANGKVSRGDEVILLARTHNDLPPYVKIKGRVGGKPFAREHPVVVTADIGGALVPRLWAAELIRRTMGSASASEPDGARGKVTSIGIEYGLMTPYTSFLALESEYAYQQQGIQRRRSPLRGVRLSSLTPQSETRIAHSVAGLLVASTGLACMSRDEAPAEVSMADGQMAPMQASKEMAPAAMPASPPVIVPTDSPPPPPPSEPMPSSGALDELRAMGDASGVDVASALGGAKLAAKDVARMRAMEKSEMRLDRDSPMMAMSAEGTRANKKVAALIGKADKQPAKEKEGKVARRAPAPAYVSSERVQAAAAPVVYRSIAVVPRACSDVAERPLAERAVIWRQRMKTARNPDELIVRYESAKAACELPDWRAEALFLRLLEPRITDEGTAVAVLSSFRSVPESQRYLARLVLRRAVDDRLVAAVTRALFGAPVDWRMIDLELQGIKSDEARLARLRTAVAAAPDDPEGMIRLVRLLAQTKHGDEALQHGRRLADLGLMTPHLARELGDILADQGLADDAIRAYSEIVEFDPNGKASRRALGDIFLARGWYGPAYRQYKTLTENVVAGTQPDPLAQLRLAHAAAGDGRVDEALRIERAVAEREGTPGPDDPRRYARLLSAARLATLLQTPPTGDAAGGATGKELVESVTRKLKELQLFRGAGNLTLVTWSDLGADVVLTTASADGKPAAVGEATDASPAGLAAVLLPRGDGAAAALSVRLRSPARDRPLKLVRHDVSYDGKAFVVKVTPLELLPRTTALSL